MFTRLTLRRLARGLLAALLFALLQPVLTVGLARPGSVGEGVQICTGFGMVWRDVGGAAVAPRTDVSPRVGSNKGDSAPATGGASTAPAHCPLCAGAALVPADAAVEGLLVAWPIVLHPGPSEVMSLASPCSARVILDAPTRGPPRTPGLA